MRRLVIASSHRDLHAPAAEFLRQASAASGELLVVAPSHGAATDFLRLHAGDGILGVHALTLNQLAAHLATPELARRGLAPVSGLSQHAIAARVIHELHTEHRLVYFHPVSDTPGFALAVARTLTELRAEGVPLAAGEDGPVGDLAVLQSAYARQLQQQALADPAELFRTAAGIESARYSGLPVLFLDVPLREKMHRDFVEAWVQRSKAVMAVALDADSVSVNHWSGILGVEPDDSADISGTALARLRRHLFGAPSAEAPSRDSTVEMFSAAGDNLECTEIARRIRQAAARGFRFDRMAILLRSPERYQPLVEEALRRASIPAYYHRGTARPDPAGRAFLALLQCAREDCSASRFAEYLSLAQTPALDAAGAPIRKPSTMAAVRDDLLAGFDRVLEAPEEAAEPEASFAAPAAWERLLVDAAVVGGRTRWSRRLEGLENEITAQIAGLKDEEDAHRQSLTVRRERLGLLRGFALPLIGLLDAFPNETTWGEWLDQLTRLAETSLRAPDSVLSLLRELRPMSTVGPVTLDEVYAVLSERLRFLRNDPPARRYGSVFVAGIEQARGRSFDAVFLPGLAEGLFPRRALEDPLLLDVHRSRVADGLARQDDRVREERLLLRIAAAAGSRLVVSYPRVDIAQSRPRVPSFYAIEVLRAAEGSLPDLREFEKRLALAAPTRLGWPAPRDTAQALDNAEYDLAALEAVHAMAPGEANGAGRYLMEANPNLARSLRVRWMRWNGRWSTADGIVDPDPATRDVLANHRLGERDYSATSLQQYAACPYKFLLYSIHRLRPREEAAPLEQMDPLTRGALFHEVQHRLFERFEAAGLAPLTRGVLEDAARIAVQVLTEVAAEYEERLAPAIARVWASEVDDLRADLHGWLHKVAVTDSDWRPVHSEYRFDGHVVLDRVRLRGAIDLIEEHVSNGALRVTDHKTGRRPEQNVAFVGGGAVLQPLLYSVVAQDLLGLPVDRGRLYYCTQRGAFHEIEIRFHDNARQRLAWVLDEISGAIEGAFLPAAPNGDHCEICDYRAVCGPYESLRLRKKPQARLEALVELRGLP